MQGYTDAHPEEVAGLFIDQRATGVVVLVTADLETHRAAIDALLPDGRARVDVRLARYTRAELEALMERIVNDSATGSRRSTRRSSAAASTRCENRVDLEISSANPARRRR